MKYKVRKTKSSYIIELLVDKVGNSFIYHAPPVKLLTAYLPYVVLAYFKGVSTPQEPIEITIGRKKYRYNPQYDLHRGYLTKIEMALLVNSLPKGEK